MQRKDNGASALGIQKKKKKNWVTMHFSEITKLQFGKKKRKTSIFALCFTGFKNNCFLIISKKRWLFLAQVLFLDFNSPC